jgi:hypothetical protein
MVILLNTHKGLKIQQLLKISPLHGEIRQPTAYLKTPSSNFSSRYYVGFSKTKKDRLSNTKKFHRALQEISFDSLYSAILKPSFQLFRFSRSATRIPEITTNTRRQQFQPNISNIISSPIHIYFYFPSRTATATDLNFRHFPQSSNIICPPKKIHSIHSFFVY